MIISIAFQETNNLMPINSPFKVLVLSNDKVETIVFKSALETKGFLVSISISTDTRKKDLENEDPDVIIIYSNQAKNHVIDLCMEIRKTSNIPILVLSSNSQQGMVEKTLNAGADEYISYPVSNKILIAHLRTLSRRSREEKKASKMLYEDVSLRNTQSQMV
jgi:DNA-binding response OmpR family regulator